MAQIPRRHRPDDQLGRDALRPQHGGDQGGVIETNSLIGAQRVVHIGQIAGRHGFGFVGVVFYMAGDIGINRLDFGEIARCAGAKVEGLFLTAAEAAE